MRTTLCSRLGVPVLASLFVLVGMGMGADDPGKVKESKGTFESQGKTIAIERYEPEAEGVYPAVLVLHGAGGMEIGGAAFQAAARGLAERGYVAVVVHYFDRTDTRSADLDTILANFPAWLDTVQDALNHVEKAPNVDGGRLGLLGFSLGAYLSLSEATRNPKVQTVVEYFGGLPRELADTVDRMPPTLILHGDADAIVPVSEARALETLYKKHGFPYEIHIYEGAGHGFFGPTGDDAFERVQTFFDTHLKAEAVPAEVEAAGSGS